MKLSITYCTLICKFTVEINSFKLSKVEIKVINEMIVVNTIISEVKSVIKISLKTPFK